MLKDFRDVNKNVITMFRGTDKTHRFVLIEETGSKFIWDRYTVSCEGRLSPANEKSDFSFQVDRYEVDGVDFGLILFPKEIVNSYIRENRISWRVIATHKVTLKTQVINYGEILLKDY